MSDIDKKLDEILMEDNIKDKIEKELLLAFTKVIITPNKLGGLHYDLPDDALDQIQALVEQQVLIGRKAENEEWLLVCDESDKDQWAKSFQGRIAELN